MNSLPKVSFLEGRGKGAYPKVMAQSRPVLVGRPIILVFVRLFPLKRCLGEKPTKR